MRIRRPLLLACAAAITLHAQTGPEAVTPEAAAPAIPEDPREVAKWEAWTSAVLIVSLLEQGDQSAFPGIHAWLDDFRQVAATTPPPTAGQPFPTVDAYALVTRNPDFWSAFYEIQPGDPGLALLHAALLLSGGEAQRAAVVAALGLQRPGAPEEIKRGLHSIIAHCAAAQAHSLDLVRLGVRLHDMGEYGMAVKQFDQALREWPANGVAHYERGSALRMQPIAEARKAGTLPNGEEDPLPDPPETVAAFARARQHDPLHLLAYQGADEQMKAGLLALVKSALPVCEAIRRKPDVAVRAGALRSFSEGCREAAIDDLALVLRQLVVAAHRHYGAEDAELIHVCLNRIAPAAMTPELLARVSGETRLPARQLVMPPGVDPLELVGKDDAPTTAPKARERPRASEATSASKKKKRVAADTDGPPTKPKSKRGRKGKS